MENWCKNCRQRECGHSQVTFPSASYYAVRVSKSGYWIQFSGVHEHSICSHWSHTACIFLYYTCAVCVEYIDLTLGDHATEPLTHQLTLLFWACTPPEIVLKVYHRPLSVWSACHPLSFLHCCWSARILAEALTYLTMSLESGGEITESVDQ